MGNCDSAQAEMYKRNRKINAVIETDRKKEDSVIRLLLLGAGDSGKSTILKQMKIIHDNGFSQEDINLGRCNITVNLIQSMGSLLDGMQKLNIPYESPENEVHALYINKVISSKDEDQPLSDTMYIAIKRLWNDQGVQMAYQKRDEFYLHDSAKYFFDNLERIHTSDYAPTEQDLLHVRMSTMGVIAVSFVMKNKIWRVFDVGGQRSQRKKWIHCFDDVKALIYVASLSEYDQVLMEDNTTNRMQESLQLFRQVINNKYFINTSVILFLNKKDIFKQKIGVSKSLKLAFPNYNGSETYEEGSTYIERKYLEANANSEKSIYCHHTCATDTEQVQFVLDSVLDTILSSKLKGCGFY
ncbi:unnamed protein product [Auanema sp. JU1783]|nr:unnamed protein product [Auanema sp. JU1783]